MIQKQLFTSAGNNLVAPDDSYLVVTALQSELPNVSPDSILFTGVGKVNATYSLTKYLVEHPEIKTVINYGTAGKAYNVNKGELIQCTTFLQGDMDCGTLTGGPGVTYGDTDPSALQFGTEGKICRTQDQFVTDLSVLDMFEHLVCYEKFNVVEMEAYALAKVCYNMHRDFICYKYVSDDANTDDNGEWEENVDKGEPMFEKILVEKHGYNRY